MSKGALPNPEKISEKCLSPSKADTKTPNNEDRQQSQITPKDEESTQVAPVSGEWVRAKRGAGRC
jgi:hypothetical protein